MKIGITTRIQYLKGCRSTVRRTPHANDSKWLEDMHDQLALIAAPPVREEAENRFERILARRRFLKPDSPSFAAPNAANRRGANLGRRKMTEVAGLKGSCRLV